GPFPGALPALAGAGHPAPHRPGTGRFPVGSGPGSLEGGGGPGTAPPGRRNPGPGVPALRPMSALIPDPDQIPASANPNPNPNLQTTTRQLYLGPAGWDYPDWQGVVYPPAVKGPGRLAFLATLFNVVEINVTFYRPIAPKDAARWLAAVAANPEFRFTAKLWQVFTHERRGAAPEWAQFKEGLSPLKAAGRLGALLAQFPYSFHNTGENREYLLSLKSHLEEYPLALEVRHRSWQQRSVWEFLQDAGL